MEQFPGRTLEELDGMDLNRVLRAKSAKRYEIVEARRRLYLAKKLKADQIEKDEWALILEMDAIMAEGG